MLVAALAHDFKHNGLNNTYHVNFRTDIATTYNGIKLIYIIIS